MSLRSATFSTALRLSHRLGGPRLWDLLRGGRTRILMYHGITARERYEGVVNHFGFNLPQSLFERHVEYLARRCNVISLADFVAGKGLSSSKTNVVLTFDDGYENNYTLAFPVLQRLGLPATFAVTSGFVTDRTPLWNDVVEFAVQHTGVARADIGSNGTSRSFSLESDGGRAALLGWLLYQCVRAGMDHRAQMIAGALRTLEVEAPPGVLFEDDDYRPLRPEQAREMADSGLIELASHSVTHPMLAALDVEDLRQELRASRAAIEEMSGRPCTSLCLPGGSYDDRVLREAAEAGYTSVLSSDEATARPGQSVLGRYGVFSMHDPARFADLVHGPVHEAARFARRTRRRIHSLLKRGTTS